jgi:signal transduction histidine kinase
MNAPHEMASADAPRAELDAALEGLIETAHRVADTQGRLRGLLRANRAVVEQAELPVVLRTIIQVATDMIGARYGALGVMSPEGGLEEFIQIGIDDEVVARIGHLPSGHGLLGAVLAEGRPVRTSSVADDARAEGFPSAHPAMNGFLGVPIQIRGQLFGSLYFAEKIAGEFTIEDEELLVALASTAGIAIENARLLDETRRRQRWSAASAEIATSLVADDTSSSLHLVADRVVDLAEADLVCVVVPLSGADLIVDTASGVLAEGLAGLVMPRAGSLSETVLETRRPVLRTRVELPADTAQGAVGGPTMFVPLLHGRESLGVLMVARVAGSRRFTAADVEMVEDFARHASLAIDVARVRFDRTRLTLLEDRSRIARDLHDHVIQRLFAAGLDLQAAARETTDGATAARLENQVDSLDSAIAEIRTAIFALGPIRASERGSVRRHIVDLIAELGGLFPRLPRLSFGGPIDLLVDDELGADLDAVVREGLTNVARHAGATAVAVRVAVHDDEVVAEITDDGCGIVDTGRSSGLANLRHRARRWRGGLAVVPGAAGGTVLTWTARLPES